MAWSPLRSSPSLMIFKILVAVVLLTAVYQSVFFWLVPKHKAVNQRNFDVGTSSKHFDHKQIVNDETQAQESDDTEEGHKHDSAKVIADDNININKVSNDSLEKLLNEDNAPSQPKVLRWDGKKWIQWPNFCQDENVKNYVVADLHSPAGHIPFYVHDAAHDSYTSRFIVRQHTYEPEDVQLMYRHLLEDPYMGLVDVGSHVGLYSATAAILGRHVLTVDALHMNMHAWCHSITKNKFAAHVKEVYTIMSRDHKLMTFKTEKIHVGGTTVHVVEDQNLEVSPLDQKYIHSATLDNFLPLMEVKRAFLKLDVEKHEYEVIAGGEKFFKEIDIPYVLMEWVHHVNGPNRQNIIDKMTEYGYKAFTAGSTETPVDLTLHQNLYNILWKKS